MELMTVAETAKMLGLSEISIYRGARRGTIPALKIGGALRFDAEILREWVRRESGYAVTTEAR